jgi:hypothetical protein
MKNQHILGRSTGREGNEEKTESEETCVSQHRDLTNTSTCLWPGFVQSDSKMTLEETALILASHTINHVIGIPRPLPKLTGSH